LPELKVVIAITTAITFGDMPVVIMGSVVLNRPLKLLVKELTNLETKVLTPPLRLLPLGNVVEVVLVMHREVFKDGFLL
jgi:hypothetical protein